MSIGLINAFLISRLRKPSAAGIHRSSLFVFKRLLKSEALQLQSKNETYELLLAWVHHSPHVKAAGAV